MTLVIVLIGGSLVMIPIVLTWVVLTQPTWVKNTPSDKHVDERRLYEHVRILSEQYVPRDSTHVENLNLCAAYIGEHFKHAGATSTDIQTFSKFGHDYKNVIAFFGTPSQGRIVIGAHYDAVEATPGADDNASGVAGLLELAYLFGEYPLPGDIELVAYTLEEPPFFGTNHMGSAYHVEQLAEHRMTIRFMIALEMIGYFTDHKDSQTFPIPLLNWLYPNTGNFIALVGRLDQRHFTKHMKEAMKGATDLPVYSFNAPSAIPGIDFSDHRNYWIYGHHALMVTDTAFYRNTAYHGFEDTADTLDYARMSQVVVGVYEAVKMFLEEDATSQEDLDRTSSTQNKEQ